jgi:protein-L-isoaspartate(D-aspartate) O-methyltransferase
MDPPPAFQEHLLDRQRMVRNQLRPRDLHDPAVLAAMERVPRHRFVPEAHQYEAYDDGPIPIGHGQTISQPYIVALMTELARPQPDAKALDVGTGSGYQAAILAELCREVYSVEIIPALADAARIRLRELGYRNVEILCGDASFGWPEHAPYDLIIAAAAPRQVPPALVEQLVPGGRLVLPVGSHGGQELVVVEKQRDGSLRRFFAGGVAFVPMTGQALQAPGRRQTPPDR